MIAQYSDLMMLMRFDWFFLTFVSFHVYYYCDVKGCLRVTCETRFVWMIRFIDTFYKYTTLDYRQYSSIAVLHTFQFKVTHAIRFSVFTSRILATDLSQSHCHFKSHMKFSFHSPIPFLPLFCSCQFRRLDSIQFLAGWVPETRLDSTNILLRILLNSRL
jgi:hypothetical protein